MFTHGRSQEGKDFRCYLGDRLDSVPCHQDERKNRMKSSLPIVMVQIILFFQSSWCKSSYSSKRPGAKQLARHGIEAILSPKQQRRSLPSLLYKSVFYCMCICVHTSHGCWGGIPCNYGFNDLDRLLIAQLWSICT